MRSDEDARAEFDAAYPRLVTVACHAAQRFFRYDVSVVQHAAAETMAQTYERWERGKRHEHPTAWVIVCAKDVCLELLRAKSETSIDATEASDISATICETLDHLSKRQRDVGVLRYMMNCDEATTASALVTTVPRVQTLAEKARSRMRDVLIDLYEELDEA
jgi:DNA-directed RNA polymerase specialized sigma24 family protein